MKRYFLETSFIINYLRGEKEAVKTLEELEGEFVSSFVCLGELYEGIHRAENKKETEQGVRTLFKGLSRVFGLNREIAENFGRVRTELRKEGQMIEDLDILIAATCIAEGCAVVTFNPKHFQRVKNLEVLEV